MKLYFIIYFILNLTLKQKFFLIMINKILLILFFSSLDGEVILLLVLNVEIMFVTNTITSINVTIENPRHNANPPPMLATRELNCQSLIVYQKKNYDYKLI